MKIQPYILGSGMAARAAREAWAILGIVRPELAVEPSLQLRRGEPLPRLRPDPGLLPVLCLANPHALHARGILAGDEAGFPLIVTEKPAAVSLEEAASLGKVKATVTVCHVYRQLWGVQELRRKVACGELGEIIAVEGRYWQSSAAQRSLGQLAGGGWKNDPSLSGPADALLDVGVHWVDAALFVLGSAPHEASVWLSHANGEASHRDTHIHLRMNAASGARVLASISKTAHGASNHFELNVLGTKGSATWKFSEPDCLVVGEGSGTRIQTRPRGNPGSIHPPFHGMGWVEGYVSVFGGAVDAVVGRQGAGYPSLREHLVALRALLEARRE